MMKIIKLNLKYLKLRNFYNKYKKFLWAGTTIWIGIFLIAFAFFFLKTEGKDTTTFAGNEYTPNQGMKMIRSNFTRQNSFTLILYRTHCPACKKVEKQFISDYSETKKQTDHDYIVLDVEKLNSSQKNELTRLVPGITVKNNHIPTPLVANIKPTSYNKATITSISKDNNKHNYEKVLEDSKKLEVKL